MYGEFMAAYATSGLHVEQPELTAEVWLVVQRDRYENMKMAELREAGERFGIFRVRTKAELVERLMQAEENCARRDG